MTESDHRSHKRKILKSWKQIVVGVPLVTAAGVSLLPLQRWGQQFLVLVVLVWIQIFIIFECFLLGK